MNEEQLNRKIKPGSVESSYVMDSLFPEELLDVSAYDVPEGIVEQNFINNSKISTNEPQRKDTRRKSKTNKENKYPLTDKYKSARDSTLTLKNVTDQLEEEKTKYGIKNGISNPKNLSLGNGLYTAENKVTVDSLDKLVENFGTSLQNNKTKESQIKENYYKAVKNKAEEAVAEEAAAKIAAEERIAAEKKIAEAARAEAADYVDLTDSRPQYTTAEDPKSFTNYTRNKIYTADGKSKYLYSPSLSEWEKIDAGTSKIDKSKVQYIPETEALEYNAPKVKIGDNNYKPFSLDGIEYPDYSKEAKQAIQDASSEGTRNNFFRRSNAYTSDPNTGKIIARGKSTASLRKMPKDTSSSRPSSLKKYGAYALGALAATALVNTMFFGDNKGEQTNAQLYGQQPLY